MCLKKKGKRNHSRTIQWKDGKFSKNFIKISLISAIIHDVIIIIFMYGGYGGLGSYGSSYGSYGGLGSSYGGYGGLGSSSYSSRYGGM